MTFGSSALDEVHRLAVARAQLDDGPLVAELARAPDRAVLLPALEVLDRRWGPDRLGHRAYGPAPARDPVGRVDELSPRRPGCRRAQSMILREPWITV